MGWVGRQRGRRKRKKSEGEKVMIKYSTENWRERRGVLALS